MYACTHTQTHTHMHKHTHTHTLFIHLCLFYTVSLQDAGQGLLGAEILHAGQMVSYQHYQVDHVTHKFTFVPMATGEHRVLLHFNGEPIMGIKDD